MGSWRFLRVVHCDLALQAGLNHGAIIIASARAVSEKIFRRASPSKIFEKFFSKSAICRLSSAVFRLSKFADFHLAFAVSQIFPPADALFLNEAAGTRQGLRRERQA